MSVNKAQGQTLKRCGVCLHTPVFAHGQFYFATSRTGSATGLRVWLGHQLGHGFQDDEENAYDGPYTHNVVYKDVIRMIFRGTTDGPGSADAASEVEPSDPPAAATAPDSSAVDPDAMAGQISSDLPAHVEFVDLTDAEQAQLHRALLQGTVSAPPEETGADSSDLAAQTEDLAAQAARAQAAGVPPSEWYAVSQASGAERDLFLAIVEAPRSSGGASSSGA